MISQKCVKHKANQRLGTWLAGEQQLLQVLCPGIDRLRFFQLLLFGLACWLPLVHDRHLSERYPRLQAFATRHRRQGLRALVVTAADGKTIVVGLAADSGMCSFRTASPRWVVQKGLLLLRFLQGSLTAAAKCRVWQVNLHEADDIYFWRLPQITTRYTGSNLY